MSDKITSIQQALDQLKPLRERCAYYKDGRGEVSPSACWVEPEDWQAIAVVLDSLKVALAPIKNIERIGRSHAIGVITGRGKKDYDTVNCEAISAISALANLIHKTGDAEG